MSAAADEHKKIGVSFAPTGRASCKAGKRCPEDGVKNNISKGDVRITKFSPATLLEEKGGYDSHYHLDCFFQFVLPRSKLEITSIDEIRGLADVDEETITLIQDYLDNPFDKRGGRQDDVVEEVPVKAKKAMKRKSAAVEEEAEEAEEEEAEEEEEKEAPPPPKAKEAKGKGKGKGKSPPKAEEEGEGEGEEEEVKVASKSSKGSKKSKK